MTSLIFRSRTALAGTAFAIAALSFGGAFAPATAQDLRDIPEKTTTSVTGPSAQPKSQPKQGREVQGPPAPLETQLRDTPPEAPILQRPQVIQPQPQNPAPPIIQTNPRPATKGAPAPANARPTSERQPANAAPQQPRGTTSTVAAPAAGASRSTPDAATSGAAGSDSTTSPLTDVSTLPATPTSAAPSDGSAIVDSGAGESAAPVGEGSMLPWALGGAALLVLGGGAYAFTRRRKPALAGDTGFGGIELGQTPFADELSENEASAPITNALKAPKPKAPAPQPAPQPTPVNAPAAPVIAAPPPPPEPVKPTADGRIVSRIKAPTGNAHIPADPQAAPPPQAPPPPQVQPPQPVKPASDGRIVSRLKVSDIVEDPTPPPPPPPQRRRPVAPSVKTVSVGYSVGNKRD